MKRSLIALAALAVVGAASAQSSVTIFGIVDAAVSIGNGDTANKTALTNSSYNSSRLGFRGVEDLGGGLKASFHLEGALSNDDGTVAGLSFQRKSVVSLMGGMGELRMGRDYTPNFWSFTVYDAFGTNGVGTTRALLGSLGAGGGGATTVRASNSIGYISPTISGFGFWGQLYFGEQLSNAVAQTGDGGAFRVSYDQGPLSLAVAYAKTTTGAGTDVQTTNFGGSYNMGVAQLMAFWNKDANTNLKDRTGYTISALVPVAPAGTVRVGFSNTDNGSGAKTDQFSLGYVHDMSKRTAVYGTFSSLSNSGGATAALNGAVTPANGSSTGFDVGVRHAF